MESMKKPHAVCIPFPAQGHINPMLKLAKLLNCWGFYVTFVHTEFIYDRLIKAKRPANSVLKLEADDFRFETVPDGLPASNPRGILDLPALCLSIPTNTKQSFRELITKLNASSPDVPPVTCIVSDGVMSFTLEVAQEFAIPEILFFTPSACAMLGYLQFSELRKRGYFPLKDESCLTNGFLDTGIDWVPAMEGIRLRDLPTFIRTTDDEDVMFNYNLESVNNCLKTGTMILNTFDELEEEVLAALKNNFPNLYTIGPLSVLHQQLFGPKLESVECSLWQEDTECLEWLDKKEPRSVVYVNYGSLVIMTPEQLREFAWGLASSKYLFLWVIRPDLVEGGEDVLSKNFLEEIKDRGLLVNWCPQEKVLSHPSVGGFLTHCGWNSTLESISAGVPMLCWPFFGDQQMNCFYVCGRWGIGMEISSDAKRGRIEWVVRELMEGETGKEMRMKMMGWKERATRATSPGGSSFSNFNSLIQRLTLHRNTA